jgi:PAS domain S-box-containing protein
VAAVGVATALRLWPLEALGTRLAWLTFYPTVMVVALYGGWWAGLLGTVLACLSVLFILPEFVHQPLVKDGADWLGLMIFSATCIMISGVAEAMHLARGREQRAVAELDRFFTLTLDMLCISNADGYFKRVSPAVTGILGWSVAEFLAQPFIELVHPDDRAATLREVERQMVAGEKVMHFENRYRHKDGTWRWLSWRSVPQPGGTMYATARDITELKLGEEALRRSEENLAVTLHSIGDAVLATDAHGRITRMNSIAEKLTGWTQAEALGRAIGEVFVIINEETRQPAIIPVEKVLATGEIHGLANHTVVIARDGTECPIADSAAPIRDREGAIIGVVLVFRDVTEEKKAEKAISESARQLRELNESLERRVAERTAELQQQAEIISGANDAIITLDYREDIIQFWNQGAERLYGWRKEEVLGKYIHTFLQTQFPKPFEEIHTEFLRDGHWQGELAHTRRDGSRITVMSSWSLQRDISGAPAAFLEINTDITDRKLAEMALRASEARLDFALKASHIGAWELDLRSHSASRTAIHAEIFGYETASAPWSFEIFLAHVVPEERAEVARLIREAMAANKDWNIECRIRRQDGEVRWIYSAGGQEQNGGVPVRASGIVQDITERNKRTEELRWKTAFLEAMVYSSVDGILVVDKRGRKIFQNQRAVDLWQIPPEIAANADDRAQFQFAAEQTRDPNAFRESSQRMIASVDAFDQDEIELKNGTVLERHTFLVKEADGKVFGRVWTFRDITQGRQLERQYRQAQKMEAIGTLAGGIAHDFNNILAAMAGYCYLLQQDMENNASAQENIGEILQATTRAKDLVQQILTFSRQREQKRQIMRLDMVVKEAIKFLRASLPAQIQIELSLVADAPAVLADATQIYQVMINLATNALHAMEGRPGKLTVKLDAFVPDEAFIQGHPAFRPLQYARLLIADTGQGMDAKTLERIYEPFFTTKPVGKGTGLGLAVVHGIMEAHEGVITVASEVDRGTTFSLYFPGQLPVETLIETTPDQVPRGQGQRILVVDDERALTLMLEKILTRLNYQVISTNRAQEAIRLFRKNPAQYDLLITDLTMPELNGLELTRQIRAIRPDMRVIMVSGYRATLTAEALGEAGVLELLEKPISAFVLAEVVHRHLRRG